MTSVHTGHRNARWCPGQFNSPPEAGADAGKLLVLRNAIARTLAAPPDKERLILFVGRIIEQKGVADLVAALEEVLPRHPHWRAEIIGSSRTRRRSEMSAFEAGLRTMPGLSDVVYPVVRLDRSVMISAVVFVTVCVVSLYPATKAALLQPVAAIRGIAGGSGRGAHGHRTRPGVRWPIFVLVAARNVLRNPRRTAITAGGTAFVIVAFVASVPATGML